MHKTKTFSKKSIVGLSFVIAILLVAFVAFGAISSIQKAVADEEGQIEHYKDLLNQPLTDEEQALVDSNTTNEQISISGTISYYFTTFGEYYDSGKCEGAKVFWNDEQVATSDTTGHFTFNVEKYSRGYLTYSYTYVDETYGQNFNIVIGYLGVKDLFQNLNFDDSALVIKRDLSMGSHIVNWSFQYFAILNNSNYGYINYYNGNNLYEDGFVVTGPKNVVPGNTSTYYFNDNRLCWGDSQGYAGSVWPTFNKGCVNDGWYTIDSVGDAFRGQSYYKKVSEGDFVLDSNTNWTMSTEEESYITNGGKILLMSRYHPSDADKYTITFKANNPTNEVQNGYVWGTSGNTGSESLESYELVLYNDQDNYLIPGSNFDRPQDVYIHNQDGAWVSHDTPGEASNPYYMMSAQGVNDYAFDSWTLTDEDGNVVENWPEKIEKNYTFTANFKEVKTLSGIVSDNGTPVAGANVQISGLGDDIYATTNISGKFNVVVPDVENPDFSVMVACNGYIFYQKNLTSIPTEAMDIQLQKPTEDTVKLYGFTYDAQAGSSPAAEAKKTPNLQGTNDGDDDIDIIPNPLYDCTVMFEEAEGYGSHKFVVQEGTSSYGYGHEFEIEVCKGHAGTLTIMHDGYASLSVSLTEEMTTSDEPIDVASIPGLVSFGGDVFDKTTAMEKWGYYGFDNSVFRLKSTDNLGLYITAVDGEQGSIIIDPGKPTETQVVYTYGGGYLVDDEFEIDFENDTLVITSYAEGLPVEKRYKAQGNEDNGYAFYQWMGTTNYGQKIDLIKGGKFKSDMVITAVFKPFAEMMVTPSEGVDSYTMTLDSNERQYLGVGPLVKIGSDIQMRQYEETQYVVEGNKIIATFYDGPANTNGVTDEYIETLTVEPNLANGATFQNWQVNGVDVADGDTGTIMKQNDVSLTAVAAPAPVNPESEDVNGSAQTGDNIPVWIFVVVAIIAAGACAGIYIYRRNKN